MLASAELPAQQAPADAQKAVAPAPAAGAAQAPAAQLKLPVPLVIEDIVVLDRNDRPVRGIKASDLTVMEDGKPVTVRAFEEHVPPAQPAVIPRLPDHGPNVFTNQPTAPVDSPLYVLLLDGLNTPLTDQVYVREQMLKYLKTLPSGMRVAIFGLGTRLYLLQGFTSNPEILKTAIDSKHSRHTSPLLDDPVSGGPTEQLSDMVQDSNIYDPNDPNEAMVVANMQQFEAETQTQVMRMRMIYTLQAMNELARYLSELPGRKSLIWFSGSFPLNIFPDEDLQDPFGPMADFQDDVQKTTDLLARSRVAVYPVDGRGLFVNPAISAAQNGASLMRSARTTPNAFAKADSKFLQQTAAEHATMDLIAKETGGKAFYNTNGLKEVVEKITEIGDHFYTIAYTPPNAKQDGGYRRIAIKVDQPGMHAEYRPGYFAADPNTEKHGQKVLPQNAMTLAMMRGGPDASQVLFDVGVVPGDTPGDTISKGTNPNLKLMKPPYLSYTLQYLVDVRAAFTPTEKGLWHGELEFAAFVYNPDGELFNSADNALTINLPAEKFADISKNGLLVRQVIEVPKKGEYFLRIGVHDVTNDRVGGVEIPLARLKTKQQLIDAARQAQGTPAKSSPSGSK